MTSSPPKSTANTITRHLPANNEPAELRRVLNRVWDTFDRLQAGNGASVVNVIQGSGGGAVITAPSGGGAPAWTKTLSPPFAVFALDSSGELITDSDGYATLVKVT